MLLCSWNTRTKEYALSALNIGDTILYSFEYVDEFAVFADWHELQETDSKMPMIAMSDAINFDFLFITYSFGT